MAGFHDIIGHEKIKEHLQKAIGYQRVSHAYILSGEEGMGRKTIAKAFAMTLLCLRNMGRSRAWNAIPVSSFCRAIIRM